MKILRHDPHTGWRSSFPAALLCVALVSVRAAETNAPALSGETNAPAASVTNLTEQTTALAEPETNGVRRLDYAAFKIINDRNIFNANRSRRSPREGRGERARQTKVESFTLVGTMSYAKGGFAFFDGSSSSYKKAVKTEDKIAGYKVTDVLPNAVRLEGNGKTIDLPVGAKMRREDEGAWKVVGDSGAARNTSSASSTEESSDSDSAGDDDVLKKMMQKRDEELNK